MSAQTPEFNVEMLGGFRLVRGGRVVTRFQAQKPGALLARLALARGLTQSREELMEALWPEVDPAAGRNRLKQTLSVLRGELEKAGVDSLIIADRAAIGLDPDLAQTDVCLFDERLHRAALAVSGVERAGLLAAAIGCWGGALLPGFYDEWVLQERERLEQAYLAALLALEGLLEEAGELQLAADAARKAIASDSSCESAHLALMRLHAAQGHPAESMKQYRELERRLDEELGARPSAGTQALLKAIKEGRVASRSAAMPTVAVAPRAPGAARLEPVGGAVPLSSEFYIVRSTDREFAEAVARQDSIVLVKGPRQVGKTSLLARGLQLARDAGARVVLTDLQRLNTEQLESPELLFMTLAELMAEQLDPDVPVRDSWEPQRGWNVSFERFLRRHVLASSESPVVWGLDEVDRLFPCSYAPDVFGLFRSWHNLRSLHPGGPWARLTLAMAHATEAHLFISDLNQSPFNVGTRLTLEDFTLNEVAELNRRYGAPLKDAGELARFYDLVGGSPYLVRRGLHEMVIRKLDFAALTEIAGRDDCPFHDHLQRLLALISGDAALADTARQLLGGVTRLDAKALYRLSSAGVLAATPNDAARFRCRLYADYLRRHLA